MLSKEEKGELLFNRQYIVAPKRLSLFDGWKETLFEHFFIYSHPNLEVTVANNGTLLLIGFLFDSKTPKAGNQDIVNELSQATSVQELAKRLSCYAGRFAILFHEANDIKIIHDATGQREVYYTRRNDEWWLSAQPSLLGKFIPLAPASDEKGFYQAPEFKKRKETIRHTTPYEGVYKLQVNHYLSICSGEVKRYFPNKEIEPVPLATAAVQAASMLRGFMEAAAHRYPLLIAVTGGWDSRLMLAASLPYNPKNTYFIIQHTSLRDTHQDIQTPRQLLGQLGIPFHAHRYSPTLGDEVKKQMRENVPLANENQFSAFYHVFFKQYKTNLNITCVSEFARNYYHYQVDSKKVDGKVLARLNAFGGIAYVEDLYQKWINDSKSIFDKYGYNILDMFYWEEKMGNWLANGRSAMGTVIEDFSLVNCHQLMELFLSVDEKNRDRYFPVLHKKIIEQLDETALSVYPNNSWKYRIIRTLNVIGVYTLYKRLHFRYFR